MSDLQRAKAMLPNMPDEVFQLWIEPLVTSNGWPFRTQHDLNWSGLWSQYFAKRTVDQIDKLVWKKRAVALSASVFQPNTQEILKLVIRAYHLGDRAAIARLANVKKGTGWKSFETSREFIRRTGSFHSPLILWQHFDGMEIADGNHRMAAAFSLQPRPRSFPAWIAKV